jgi:transglutaminase-like putative cysteine protease
MIFALQAPTLEASTGVNDALNGTNPAWQTVQNTWTRLFSSLRTYSAPTNDKFADNLSLGGPRTVGDSLVMDIFVSDELPFAYWHAISYETYENGLWQSPLGSQTERIPDDGYFIVPEFQSRKIITQTVRNYLPSAGQIYGLPDIIGSDRQMFVTSRPEPGEEAKGAEQISMVQSKYVLQQGEIYNSASLISVATQTDLRNTSTRYPAWTESYTALPDTVTQRTRDLADELAAPHDNSYDQAIAIQNFLRDHIEYNDQIDAPPDGAEPVDYVLFEVSEGYCNYYSSAMVVMLRHLGIPSRPASGFAAGEFIEDAGLYRVRSKDAHTWVEAWFPEYGWIQFEPTSSIAVPARAEGGSVGSAALTPAQEEENARDVADALGRLNEDLNPGDLGNGAFPDIEPPSINLSQFTTLPVILAVLLVIAVGGASGYTTYTNRQAEADLAQSYARLGKWGDRLGATVTSAQTPTERANVMVTVLPSGKKSINKLTDQFVRSRYSREQVADPNFNAQDEWNELRPMFNKSWVNLKLQAIRRWRSRFF